MRRQDLRVVGSILSDVLYAYGFMLLVPALLGLILAEYRQALTFAAGAALVIPSFWFLRRRTSATGAKKYHGAVALALLWTILSVVSCVPFLVDGMAPVDALYEAFSAWTDTGLTMIEDPSVLPVSLSLFRILMQWISGLGIVMFMLFLRGPSPKAAQTLFQAEGRFEDFDPNIWQVGRTIVLIYIGYTVIGFVLLWVLGVPPFDALMHAITSLSTGGFSTNSVGVGLYGALPSIVAMVLMLAGGISFSSHQALTRGNVTKFSRNPEVRVLFAVVFLASGLLLFEQWLARGRIGEHVLESVFYVVTAVTTCGAGTTLPLTHVPDVFLFTVLFLMVSGAVYGSTTGALKLWRLIIIGKVIGREVRRPFYPTGTVMPILMGNNLVSEETVLQVTTYALLYLALGVVGSLIFMLFGYRSLHALFTVFSAQGNVGLNAMPSADYYGMHGVLKVQLILHMLVGRMEIFPLLYLLRGLRE